MDCQSLSLWERWHCTSNDGEGEPSILSNFLHQFVDFFFGSKTQTERGGAAAGCAQTQCKGIAPGLHPASHKAGHHAVTCAHAVYDLALGAADAVHLAIFVHQQGTVARHAYQHVARTLFLQGACRSNDLFVRSQHPAHDLAQLVVIGLDEEGVVLQHVHQQVAGGKMCIRDRGSAAFGYMLPILSAFIAMSIADRPGLAVGFVGGVLAMNGTNFAGIAAGETTGVSGGFLAALLAGFAAGYIVELLKKITEKLPASLNGIRPMLIYPLGGMLILGAVMCGINPVMGMINTAMTDCLNAMGGTSKVLLGAIVAGMMSIDMGGPFNKAAYVFGTAALASGNYEVMAAVMVGGMVPPIAIALSTTFCPKKWTADERRNGIVNYVMGLCFVTEGAIPYAAADPLRVLPSCVAGAAVAGALSMTFGCALRAPHGGIFVFPVVDHTALYCVALAVGSVLGAVILSLLKKNRTDAE